MDTFGERLSKLRIEKGFTQETMANALDMDKHAISNYEHGRRSPDIETLSRIADLLNVSTDFLLGRINPKLIENVDTSSRTGLNDEAINQLADINKQAPEYMESVNAMISNDWFPSIIETFHYYARANFSAEKPFAPKSINPKRKSPLDGMSEERGLMYIMTSFFELIAKEYHRKMVGE